LDKTEATFVIIDLGKFY